MSQNEEPNYLWNGYSGDGPGLGTSSYHTGKMLKEIHETNTPKSEPTIPTGNNGGVPPVLGFLIGLSFWVGMIMLIASGS